MSEIDAYRHTILGMIICPSTYSIEHGNIQNRRIPIYRLDENTVNTHSFDGKKGDILLGGGSGEVNAMRISIPDAFFYCTHEQWNDYDSFEEIIKPFWNMTTAYVLCEGYAKIGWNPEKDIEDWLVQHILSYLIKSYPDHYTAYIGNIPLKENGSICMAQDLDSA